MFRLLCTYHFGDLGGPDVIFEVNPEALDPQIKLFLGKVVTQTCWNWIDFSSISLQLDEIFQEDAHQVGADVSSFFLRWFFWDSGGLFVGLSYFRNFQLFVDWSIPAVETNILSALALVLLIAICFKGHCIWTDFLVITINFLTKRRSKKVLEAVIVPKRVVVEQIQESWRILDLAYCVLHVGLWT